MNGAQQAEQIFDAAARAACEMALQHRISEKKEQIRSVTCRECGNCDLWMTSYCKPEKERGQFKSMSSRACGDFILSWGSKRLIAEFTAELEDLQQKSPTGSRQ